MQVRSRNTPLILLITLGFLEIACSKKLPDDVHLRTALNNWVIVLNRDTPLNGYGEKAVFTLEVSGPVAPVMAGDENTIKYPFTWKLDVGGGQFGGHSNARYNGTATFRRAESGKWFLMQVEDQAAHCWGCQQPLSYSVD